MTHDLNRYCNLQILLFNRNTTIIEKQEDEENTESVTTELLHKMPEVDIFVVGNKQQELEDVPLKKSEGTGF